MTGHIVQISVNSLGGVPKHRVACARMTLTGVEGDRQRNLAQHGGPTRAVCLYSLEKIQALRQEGHPIAAGTTGENLTIAGLEWSALRVGSRLLVGDEARLELTRPTTPCKNIVDSFLGGDFSRISEAQHPGWSRFYARVLREGMVREGDRVDLEVEPG